MLRVTLAVAFVLCLPGGSLMAQAQPASPSPGARVRVNVPCGAGALRAEQSSAVRCSVVGEFVAARADSLRLITSGSTVGWRLSMVSRLEVSRGYRSHKLAGAAVGFLVGAGVTYFVLNSGGSTSPCDRSANQDAMNARECLGLAALGGAAGAGLGALIGGRLRTERWQDVPLERLRVSVTPGGAGRIGMSLTF